MRCRHSGIFPEDILVGVRQRREDSRHGQTAQTKTEDPENANNEKQGEHLPPMS
jgi:hypothetical protein